MEKKYYDFIKFMNNEGWQINIEISDNVIEGWICHKSWIKNNLYESRALPTFSAYSFENLFDKIMDYFHIKLDIIELLW